MISTDAFDSLDLSRYGSSGNRWYTVGCSANALIGDFVNMYYERMKIAIYTFNLHGEDNGALKGTRKILHKLANIYVRIDLWLWLSRLNLKAKLGSLIRFILGMDRE